MPTREENILEAALTVFCNYGVKRTSMNDIAVEAGVSRQTLYNAYKNKDEIMRAIIRSFTEGWLGQIHAGLPHCKNLGEKLDLVFEHSVLAPFATLQNTPNAEDLIQGFNRSSEEEITVAKHKLRTEIETILRPYTDAFARTGFSPAELASLIEQSTRTMCHEIQELPELKAMLATLRNLCVVAAGEKAAPV